MNNKLLSFVVILALILMSCQAEKKSEGLTVEDKKALLSEKQSQKKELEKEISQLQDEIVKLSPELQAQPTLVDTIHLYSETFVRSIEIQGSIEADERVSVVSEIPGRIISLNAKEGDYIKAGQLIAKLDVESIDRQIAEVNTSLSLAQDVFDRQSRLWDQNIGSEVQYLQAKNNVDRLNKSLETLNFQLTKANVYAPISGSVDIEAMRQGEYASPGMPIIQILNTSKIKVVTDLPERYLRILKQGDWVDMDFPSIDMQMKGKVTQMGRTIDPANRTLEVKIAPSKYSNLLKPNLMAEIMVEELNIPNVITIPVEYILQEVDGKEFVYVVTSQNNNDLRAEKRYIQTGESALNRIIVTSGLSDQDIVVSKGSRNLSNGELVAYMNK